MRPIENNSAVVGLFAVWSFVPIMMLGTGEPLILPLLPFGVAFALAPLLPQDAVAFLVVVPLLWIGAIVFLHVRFARTRRWREVGLIALLVLPSLIGAIAGAHRLDRFSLV